MCSIVSWSTLPFLGKNARWSITDRKHQCMHPIGLRIETNYPLGLRARRHRPRPRVSYQVKLKRTLKPPKSFPESDPSPKEIERWRLRRLILRRVRTSNETLDSSDWVGIQKKFRYTPTPSGHLSQRDIGCFTPWTGQPNAAKRAPERGALGLVGRPAFSRNNTSCIPLDGACAQTRRLLPTSAPCSLRAGLR